MTQNKITSVGGARIGWINATFPFASLTANSDELHLNASLIGKYSFSPDQVIEIETYTTIPVLGWGIKIIHNVESYPKHIVFWCFGTPNSLVAQIKETGFIPSADPNSVPLHRGMAVRWQALIGIIVLWNLLFLADMERETGPDVKPGLFACIAIALLFCGSIALWRVRWLQILILKPGRSPSEIKAWLYLLAFISGIMSIFLTIMLLTR